MTREYLDLDLDLDLLCSRDFLHSLADTEVVQSAVLLRFHLLPLPLAVQRYRLLHSALLVCHQRLLLQEFPSL